MDEQAVYRELNTIFAEVFARSDIALGPDLTAQDVRGWDSFKQVQIIIAAERAFGFRFESEDIDDLANLGDFVGVILRHVAAG